MSVRAATDNDKPEAPYASFVDLFTGILLMFLVLVALLALRQSGGAVSDLKKRGDMVEGLEAVLKHHGMDVSVDRRRGILHISEKSVTFGSGSAELQGEHTRNIDLLAKELRKILPCHSRALREIKEHPCPKDAAQFAAVMIEGHTDSQPVGPNTRFKDNWDLGAARAATALREILRSQPELQLARSDFQEAAADRSSVDTPLFSIAGYADTRPVSLKDPSKNRRIDVRFLLSSEMAGTDKPEPPTISQTIGRLLRPVIHGK